MVRSKADKTKRVVFHLQKHFISTLEIEGQRTQALTYDRKPSFCPGMIGGEGDTTSNGKRRTLGERLTDDDGASREYEMPKNITAWWTRDTKAGAESKEYLVLHVSLQNEN